MAPKQVESPEAVKKRVAEKVKNKNCILFLGAGVHAPPPTTDKTYVYPEEHRPLLGRDLAQKLDEECNYRKRCPEERCVPLQRLWQGLAKELSEKYNNQEMFSDERCLKLKKLWQGLAEELAEKCSYKEMLSGERCLELERMWQSLAREVAKKCNYREMFPDERCLELQRVSLCYQEDFGRNELVDALDRYLRVGRRPSPALKMLAKLPFKIFVTTNYDLLLDDALIGCKKKPHPIIYKPNFNTRTEDVTEDPTEDQPLLFKMHGDLEHRDSIVITDEDYIRFVQRMSDKDALHPVPQTVRYRMKLWSILFVGYSLRDYNLRLIFRTLRWQVDPANFPRAYSIVKNPDPLILEVYQNEERFISFVSQDLWTFVPWLYKEVTGEEYNDERD